MREKLFLTYDDYSILLAKLYVQIIDNPKSKDIKYVYGIIRGGLPIAVHLSHKLGVPLLEQNIFPLENIITINYKNILIVDDICDTGITLEKYKDFQTATLFYKTRAIIKPTYYAETTDKWVSFPWEKEDEIPNREE